ncbi:hypothetical protein M3Y98_01058600 [Aphelenchoides besseyi]|nr:hypothetical protein M3Y98_01058600 [Aphelenchoides besseyi]KAI6209725.1 hypothetical protein M3Y96_00251100 [Aphelenchoides besseyi]
MEFENFALANISTVNGGLEALKFPIKLSDWDTYDRRLVPDKYDVHKSKWKNDNDKNFRKALENNVKYLVNSVDQMIKNAQYLLDVANELGVEIREINVQPEIRISLDNGNEQWMKKCDDALKREFGLTLFNEENKSVVLEREKRTQLTLSLKFGDDGKKHIEQRKSGDDYTGSECEYRRSNYGSESDEELE